MNRKMHLSYGREGATRLMVMGGGGGRFKGVVIYCLLFIVSKGGGKGIN